MTLFPAPMAGPEEDLTGVTVEEDIGFELELAIKKARKVKLRKDRGEEALAARIGLLKVGEEQRKRGQYNVFSNKKGTLKTCSTFSFPS